MPAGTVTVVNVPSDQRPRGVTVRIFPVASHDRSTGFAGSTLMAAATDAASIGVVKAMVTGSVSPRSVEKVVVKAVWASGRIGVVRVATVVCGLAGSEDADAEDESQAEREADPGQGRASQKCADTGREGNGGGQQRIRGLTQ